MSSRECKLELPTTNMADGEEDIVLFGDDFDAILDLLEQDEDMEEQFKASVENVSMICFLFDYNLVHNAKISTLRFY